MDTMQAKSTLPSKLVWSLVAIIGAISFGMLALSRGEHVNAVWLVLAAACVYSIAYRFYSLFIATKVFELNPRRLTPAHRLADGLDYVPTNKYVLFGHHFAAIAGAGPLVGPILAAQMGFLPGTIWLLVGVVLAGAVQDFLVLFISTRRDGRSLGEMAKQELGPFAGIVVMLGALGVMIIILAVLALVVVKALAHSPWGVFSIAATIPIALFMGVYMRFIRPGRIAEVSIIGFVLMMLAIVYGGHVAADPYWGEFFTLTGTQLTWCLIIYGFIASVLPVWLLLAPRDYLSTFLKIGVILGLAVGIVIALPDLKMPAVTHFIDGTGPVFSGSLFPFLFITIACGAISGFHALVSSGTTPKLVDNEVNIRMIGYGGMLMESFVGIMAMICATVLDPGVYFAINAPAAVLGTTVESAAEAVRNLGFVVTPEMLTVLAQEVGESSILSRTGGAPTFAIGMAHIISEIFNSRAMMAFWYHFAILFEALFILTAVDAGTRACRFMVQDTVGIVIPAVKSSGSFFGNLLGTAVAVGGWGFFVYQGVIDPLGGVNSLWPLFGVGNQMLASMALILGTVILFKMKKEKYVWVTIIPTIFLFITCMTAGWQKIFHENPKIGFLAQAHKFSDAIARGEILKPAKTIAEMQTIVMSNQINAALCGFFMIVSIVMIIASIGIVRRALASPTPTVNEAPAVYTDPEVVTTRGE
ncbi:carbon starvation protein A [Acinetobacter baumannii]|mgnify:FL=1|jgi:Carbon starvation protein, predicted membrane protein|uniref:Carbon starvation CstA family protein n=21 Tax=Acinetobacter baumannii TaxID=470 RepID=V5VCN9_ACIBA|nr:MULTISPECIES: carbon starvation CstA family protein [Acinetobacter]EXB51670.1 carbon starvation CstA family protein [Acinetobacter baumannii 1440422]EYD50489.1 carbon starvation CstA family protein [Acinetobacter baumannii 25493_4]CAH1088800.1 carbon starvation protein A [Acinetobacter phage MD-2021a]AGH36293.1 carbon starvation protein A [Acinetobacter baumannii D1279779]AGQ07453.1 Carbon starvation protein, predicted membrane protein [Acinetobacter baumannii BJAB0715]